MAMKTEKSPETPDVAEAPPERGRLVRMVEDERAQRRRAAAKAAELAAILGRLLTQHKQAIVDAAKGTEQELVRDRRERGVDDWLVDGTRYQLERARLAEVGTAVEGIRAARGRTPAFDAAVAACAAADLAPGLEDEVFDLLTVWPKVETARTVVTVGLDGRRAVAPLPGLRELLDRARDQELPAVESFAIEYKDAAPSKTIVDFRGGMSR